MDSHNSEVDLSAIGEVLRQAKILARKYRQLTGKPLGITGEVAEYEAARLLGLQLCTARQSGYDATREVNGFIQKIQIKGRCVLDKKKSQKLGAIKAKHVWDCVLYVELDEDFEPIRIYEAQRLQLTLELAKPGSRARERGELSVTAFKRIAQQVWPQTMLQ